MSCSEKVKFYNMLSDNGCARVYNVNLNNNIIKKQLNPIENVNCRSIKCGESTVLPLQELNLNCLSILTNTNDYRGTNCANAVNERCRTNFNSYTNDNRIKNIYNNNSYTRNSNIYTVEFNRETFEPSSLKTFIKDDVLQSVVEMSQLLSNENRMVLDPKSTTHNDYGSIHSQEFLPHTLLSPKTSLSLSSPPTLTSTDEPNTSTVCSPPSSTMTQSDLYQRQPLIPTPTKPEIWAHCSKISEEYFDDEEEGEDVIGNSGGTPNGVIKIDMPPPTREEPRFPKEKWKTLIAFLILVLNFIITTASLALVHERVPDRNTYGPLPDIFLDLVPAYDWALDVSEILIMISINTAFLVLLFHKHRFIVFRRVLLLLSLLYMMRSITMYVTVLPVASKTYYCSPKVNSTSAYIITTRVLQLISGFGLSINGRHTYCGDYIYSGHTVMLVLSYLIISEYSPKKFFLLHWASWLAALVGIIMVLLAHGHYTIDILIAYYVTTRLFWTYHTMCNNAYLKQYSTNNYLGKEWWFRFFQYFEKNVGGVVPRQYDWPLPRPIWPRRFIAKHPNRNS